MIKNKNLTFWMLLLGAFAAFMSGSEILRRWAYLLDGARTVDALILVSGIMLFASGSWRALRRSWPPTASWLGAAGAALFTVTIAAGLLSGAIPCSGVG